MSKKYSAPLCEECSLSPVKNEGETCKACMEEEERVDRANWDAEREESGCGADCRVCSAPATRTLSNASQGIAAEHYCQSCYNDILEELGL